MSINRGGWYVVFILYPLKPVFVTFLLVIYKDVNMHLEIVGIFISESIKFNVRLALLLAKFQP